MRVRATDWAPLAVILLVVGWVGFGHLDAHGMMVWDEAEYASLGRSIAQGEGYRIGETTNTTRPPVLPASVAAALTLTGFEADAVTKIPVVLFALAAIVVVYAVVWVEWGVWPAKAAAWSLAVFPEFSTRLVVLLSEVPFMGFYSAALFCFYLAFRRGGCWFYWGWGCFALALSTRYTALLFGPTLLLVFLYEWRRDKERFRKVMCGRAFWAAPFVGVAILAPWYLRQWMVAGDALVGVKYAASQIPTYDIATMPWYFYFVQALPAMTIPGAVSAVVGLGYGALIARKPLAIYAACGVAVIVGWHTLYDYKEVRLVTAALPFLAVGVGCAVHAWASRFHSSVWLKAGPVLLLLAATASSVRVTGGHLRYRRALGEPAFTNAMAFVRARLPEDVVLMSSNQPQLHWYSRRRSLDTSPFIDEFRSRMEEVDWLVLTNFERGQPKFLMKIWRGVQTRDTFNGNVHLFKDDRHQTLLVKADWALEQLER